jgi:hypothetical protein
MPWPTNSRTTEKPVRLDVLLDRRADVRHRAPGFHRLDPVEQRLFGHPQQRGCLAATQFQRHGHGAIAEETVEPGAHVDGEDVSFDERPLRRDPDEPPARLPIRRRSPDSRDTP